MTRKDIIDEISKNLEVPATKSLIKDIVEGYEAALLESLLNPEEDWRIAGLGTFTTVVRKPRTAVNPKTREKIKIPAKRTVKFKISKPYKERLNTK